MDRDKKRNQNTVQMLYIHLKTLRLLFLYLLTTLTKQASKLAVAIATGARFYLLVPRGLHTRDSCVSKNEGTYRPSSVATRIYN